MAALGAGMVLMAVAAPPAAAADEHIILFKDEDSNDTDCFDKDVSIIVPNPVNDDVTYVCYDWPGPL